MMSYKNKESYSPCVQFLFLLMSLCSLKLCVCVLGGGGVGGGISTGIFHSVKVASKCFPEGPIICFSTIMFFRLKVQLKSLT